MDDDVDMFDRMCYRRVFLAKDRHVSYRTAPHRSLLWKAQRGTLSDSWQRRLVELHGNVISYYGNGEQLQALEAQIAELRAELKQLNARAAVPTHDVARLGTPATAAAAAGGPVAWAAAAFGGAAAAEQPSIRATVADLQRRLSRKEHEHERLRQRSFRKSFHVTPGRTEVLIPTTESARFPTPYVFQLVNPALDELPMARRTAGAGAAGASTRERRSSAPAATGGGDATSAAAAMSRLELAMGGTDRDVLTLCADDSSARRVWVILLRSRLRSRDFPDSLHNLYLRRRTLELSDAAGAAAGGGGAM